MKKRQMSLFYNPEDLLKELTVKTATLIQVVDKLNTARSNKTKAHRLKVYESHRTDAQAVISEISHHWRTLSQTPPPSPIKIGEMIENPTEALTEQPSFFDTIPNS